MKLFLTIAASDTSGGAGIIQDIRVAESLGYVGLCAITATTQCFNKVFEVFAVNDNVLEAQLNVLQKKFVIDVLKIGVIVNEKQIQIISNFLQKTSISIKVIDTVFSSSSGKSFLSENLIEKYKNLILPFSSFITPNKQELELLTDKKIDNFEEAIEEAIKLHNIYGCGIVVKGGHFFNDCEKIKEAVIYDNSVNFVEKKRQIFNYSHGTGCAFSSAFAVFLNETNNPFYSLRKATLWVDSYFLKLNKVIKH